MPWSYLNSQGHLEKILTSLSNLYFCWYMCYFISLYTFKKISCWELISLECVYLANQKGKIQGVIQLFTNEAQYYGGTRICVVHSSKQSVTSLTGNAFLILFSSNADMLLNSRAANTHKCPILISFLFLLFFFSNKRPPKCMDVALPLSNKK